MTINRIRATLRVLLKTVLIPHTERRRILLKSTVIQLLILHTKAHM